MSVWLVDDGSTGDRSCETYVFASKAERDRAYAKWGVGQLRSETVIYGVSDAPPPPAVEVMK